MRITHIIDRKTVLESGEVFTNQPEFSGACIFVFIPAIFTPVCAKEVSLAAELSKEHQVFLVVHDNPFATQRWLEDLGSPLTAVRIDLEEYTEKNELEGVFAGILPDTSSVYATFLSGEDVRKLKRGIFVAAYSNPKRYPHPNEVIVSAVFSDSICPTFGFVSDAIASWKEIAQLAPSGVPDL